MLRMVCAKLVELVGEIERIGGDVITEESIMRLNTLIFIQQRIFPLSARSKRFDDCGALAWERVRAVCAQCLFKLRVGHIRLQLEFVDIDNPGHTILLFSSPPNLCEYSEYTA